MVTKHRFAWQLLSGFRLPRMALLLLILGLGCQLLFDTGTVRADLGPKPSVTFRLADEIVREMPISIVVFECDDATCTTSHPWIAKPEPFSAESWKEAALFSLFFVTCDPEESLKECTFVAYTMREYMILTIEFENHTLESNVFTQDAFQAVFDVSLKDGKLLVSENLSAGTGGYRLNMVRALVATLLIEGILAWSYLRLRSLPRKMLLWALLASVLSLPVAWLFIAKVIGADFLSYVFLMTPIEGAIILFEAEFVYFAGRIANRKVSSKPLSRAEARTLSFIMNSGSFLLGLCTLTLGIWWLH